MSKPNFFNKRELEKKREQKRQEKQKRKEVRKTNSSGGFLENMIAYVDENGVISDSPMDPNNNQQVDLDTIIISTPKKEETEEVVLKGRVEHYNETKNYGFIKDLASTEKYFFHISNTTGDIKEGDLVFFELAKGQKGLNAVKITRAN